MKIDPRLYIICPLKIYDNNISTMTEPINNDDAGDVDIIVDGNIGVGKSTILKIMQDYPDEAIDVSQEPVDIWNKLGLLDKFYKDPKRWAYTFQSIACATRLSMLLTPRTAKGIRIRERSLFADKMCFASAQYDLGNMNDIEWHGYSMWYDIMIGKFPEVMAFSKVIYLRASPEACLRRINARSRNSEGGIELSYLQLLHSKYEQWLMSPEMKSRVHIIDVEDDWESEESYRGKIQSELRAVVADIRKSKTT
jgi:deoxyadenosine/deoxycytidine kinase